MTRRSDVIQIRVSDEEKARISGNAGALGVSVSEYVRHVVLGDVLVKRQVEQASSDRGALEEVPAVSSQPPPEAPAEPVLHRCPFSGCRYSAPSSKAKCPVHGRTVV